MDDFKCAPVAIAFSILTIALLIAASITYLCVKGEKKIGKWTLIFISLVPPISILNYFSFKTWYKDQLDFTRYIIPAYVIFPCIVGYALYTFFDSFGNHTWFKIVSGFVLVSFNLAIHINRKFCKPLINGAKKN